MEPQGRGERVKLNKEGEREIASHDMFHPAKGGIKAIRVLRPGL